MRIEQSHVKPFRHALLKAGISQELSYQLPLPIKFLSVIYQLQLPMATPFSPEQLAWLEAKFSGPTPPHSSAGSGTPLALALWLLALQRTFPPMLPPVSPNQGGHSWVTVVRSAGVWLGQQGCG